MKATAAGGHVDGAIGGPFPHGGGRTMTVAATPSSSTMSSDR